MYKSGNLKIRSEVTDASRYQMTKKCFRYAAISGALLVTQLTAALAQPSNAQFSGTIDINSCRKVGPFVHCFVFTPQGKMDLKLSPDQLKDFTNNFLK
jgi:hypothetical protein